MSSGPSPQPNPPQPRSLLVKPASGDCNLHCVYCFYHDRPTDPYRQGGRRRMSPTVLDALIRQGMELDRRQAVFGWQGGEPTLCGLDFFKEAVELEKRYGSAGQAVSNGLQTNGLLLTPEWARFLREYKFLLGVSLDGPAAYHDFYRVYAGGTTTHAKVVSTLSMLRQYHVEYNVLTVVNRITADHGVEIYEYLLNEGHHFMQFIPCVEVDPDTGEIASFSVSPEQYGDFMCAVFDQWYNGGHPEGSVRDFEAILVAYMGQDAPLCCYQKECGSYLVVEYNGDLYPCDFLVRDDLYMGNLLDGPLDDVFESEALAHFRALKADSRPECRACQWLQLCNQGCFRFVNLGGRHRHHLCRAYQQFFAYSQEGFVVLRDRLLRRLGESSVDSPGSRSAPVGRNDPCPCGSGKKYKQCCGRKGGDA